MNKIDKLLYTDNNSPAIEAFILPSGYISIGFYRKFYAILMT